jgi:hypothetical protein
MNTTRQPIRSASVEAKVIRADGTVQDLGMIAYYSRNPFKRLAWAIAQALHARRAGRINVK